MSHVMATQNVVPAQLQTLCQLVKAIRKVCELYSFKECLNDPRLGELCSLVQSIENSGDVPELNLTKELQGSLKQLALKEELADLYLNFMITLEDGVSFYLFLERKQFVCWNGQAIFEQVFELITAELQHEEYNEIVLNHVIAATKLLWGMLDANNSLISLMSAIAKTDIANAIVYIETTKKNLNLIEIWFSRAEHGFKENVIIDLECIMKTGRYIISVNGFNSLILFLEYEPSSSARRPSLNNVPHLQAMDVTESWDHEKINDFVVKVEMLEEEKDEGGWGQQYLQFNRAVLRLFGLFGKLRESGHSEYLQGDFTTTLYCSSPIEELVSRTEKSLTDWVHESEHLHRSYKWLLFFGVPKLMRLHALIVKEPPPVPEIVREIGFLFEKDLVTQQTLHAVVMHATKAYKSEITLSTPMDVVGAFLAHLFFQEIDTFCLPKRYNLADSQSLLIRLIVGIYGGLPEAFEVLHCNPTTTEQELKLFMKRITQHPRQYVILEVNCLPYNIQEVLLKLFLVYKDELCEDNHTHIHFIETAPSQFREIPGLRLVDYEEAGPPLDHAQTQNITRKSLQTNEVEYYHLELVYGLPGIGKTHYVTQKLNTLATDQHVTIVVNETFSTESAISKLTLLPHDVKECAVFFNFSFLPPLESYIQDGMKEHYRKLIKEVRWFFFDLLILGYVEDPATGLSFQLPGGLMWTIYVEVPSSDIFIGVNENFQAFTDEQMPVLSFIGYPYLIDVNVPYSIDDDVQLVCKYLRAYESGDINRLYNEWHPKPVKFSPESDLPSDECQQLLEKSMPPHIKGNKITQTMFIRYLIRRCIFLDNLPGFNYNMGFGEYVWMKGKQMHTDTSHLGSTLMETMLKEASDLCDPSIKESWSQNPHQQLIYDFKDGGGSFGLISLLPDSLQKEEKEKFLKIGVHIPSMEDLYSRMVLDAYLSRALGVPLKDGRLAPIDERNYVLTLDYTLKMLNIHERHECGVPVIIEGETGVGKTALVEMLSQLWNFSWLAQWKRVKDHILGTIYTKIQGLFESKTYDLCMESVYDLSVGKEVSEEALQIIGELPDKDGQFYTTLNKSLTRTLGGAPILFMLDLDQNGRELLSDASRALETESNSKATAHLLHIIFSAKLKGAFYKLNVHAALQQQDIKKFFEPVFAQAHELQMAYNVCDPTKRTLSIPSVTAYLDEINTSSCLGLFKEIITDRTIDGKPIPWNVFIIAACNPHRGDSLASHSTSSESWLKGSYYVHRLHPTLQFLKWDYGSLNEYQEREYVYVKMTMLNPVIDLSAVDVLSLTELIVTSQNKVREYAIDQLQMLAVQGEQAKVSANSSVSQRDIQRVFTFYQWLMRMYEKLNPHNELRKMHHRRAVLVSLGLVYFMRLNLKYRSSYREYLDCIERMSEEVTFSQAFKDELEWFIHRVQLPPGIAKTNALKENVFAIIACTATNTPLIIVGEPGSSKTLSFNIAIANIKGKESRVEEFRDTDIFHSLDPHFYQCSQRTTSKEVDRIFKLAVNRQHSLAKVSLPIYCVVFMDVAGLPEERLESLKALHQYLDRQEVSFVAISNHILDAAKTNRAISLFRSAYSVVELSKLAEACMLHVPAGQMLPEMLMENLCLSYSRVLQQFWHVVGLRDFVHFITNLCKNWRDSYYPQLILESLERNFNGVNNFDDLCHIFFSELGVPAENVHHRCVLDILKSSLQDCTHSETDDVHTSVQSEVRYKLIIDPSEDDSLFRLLFSHGVLERENTRLYICSDFPGDSQMRVNTIAQISYSVSIGHTVLMCETDEIHDSLYDLFNQRFRSIQCAEHCIHHYTDIAVGAHSKPCRVHPDFQCVVVIKKSEAEKTPASFLSRFEKYYLTHEGLLEAALNTLPACIGILLRSVHAKVRSFIDCVELSSLYGCTAETLNSLILTILPPVREECLPLPAKDKYTDGSEDAVVTLLKTLLDALRDNAGFFIPVFLEDELKPFCEHILISDPKIHQVMSNKNVGTLVSQTLHVLHHSPGPDDAEPPLDIHTDSCMVISLLVQWLVSFLSKRLLQLLTPEALIVHAKEIPNYYLQSYLRFQEHFSLKKLVEHQLLHLKRNNWNATVCATKLLCFTRSSPLIRQIPAEFPSVLTTESVANLHVILKEYVFPDLSNLVLCSISVGHSQSVLEKLLSEFVHSDAQLLLLIANMQEITKKMINHLRIMIEEAERQKTNHNKLIVLLLHFPPMMFFDHCYPSLFLQGWDHHYLDTIAHGTLTSDGSKVVISTEEWLHKCCLPESASSLNKVVEALIPQAIPMLASRSVFNHGYSSFGTSNTIYGKIEAIKDLLMKKGIGKILVARFCISWKPSLEMEKVIENIYTHRSTLSISDFMLASMSHSFFNFLIYMLSKRISELDIDLLIQKDSFQELEDLFQGLVEVLPVPPLVELTTTQCSRYASKLSGCVPRFPFFKYVCEIVENAIDEVKIEGFATEMPEIHNWYIKERNYIDSVTSMIKEHLKMTRNCLLVAVEAMDKDPSNSIWKRYFEDFVHFKLHLKSRIPELTKELLESFIGIPEDLNALTRLVSLHVRFHVYMKNAPRLILNSVYYTIHEEIQAFGRKGSLSIVSIPDMPLSLASFIMQTLFHYICYLVSATLQAGNVDILNGWYQHYHDHVVCTPDFEEDLFSFCTPTFEAQLNIMHATYLVMQCSDKSCLRGREFFSCMYSKYFKTGSLEKGKCPRLCDIVYTCLEMDITLDSASNSLLERLFSFFFTKHRNITRDYCWFLDLANQQVHFCHDVQSRSARTGPLQACTTMNAFKFYLSKILRTADQNKGIFPYDIKRRRSVGEVLTALKGTGSPGPYIPPFYQLDDVSWFHETAKNPMMQQPLAHLYFTIVLEFLQSKEHSINYLLRLAKTVTEKRAFRSTPDSERVLLFIEKQAIVQVLLQQLAIRLDPKHPGQSLFFSHITTGVNAVLDDETMGGSSTTVSGHGLVLALHLLKQLKSSSKLVLMLISDHSRLSGISCLKPIQSLIQNSSEDDSDLFPFITPETTNSEMGKLYQQIFQAMADVHNNRASKESVDVLVRLTEQSCKGDSTNRIRLSNDVAISRKMAFRMLLWLCAYHKFFCMEKYHSWILADAIGNNLRGVIEPEFIAVLQSFIYPKYMLHKPEAPLAMDENAQRLAVTETPQGIQVVPLQGEGRKTDPIFELFNHCQDPSDVQLRHAIANMVAVVLASEPRSNHLWYHMFAADALQDTYMTGFMYDSKVTEGHLYDCGVELTSVGRYRPDYLLHASQSPLSLHSLYLILWANFAAFSMALLTQQDAQQKISGPVISPLQPIRHYCVSQLRALWLHMGNNLKLSLEEQSFFVMRCMHSFLEIGVKHPQTLQSGLFQIPQQLNSYEKMWHDYIFTPNYANLKKMFIESSSLHRNTLFKNLRVLDAHYPHFLTMDEFSHSLLSKATIGDINNPLYVITQFALEYPHLRAGGALLPDLIQLYWWMHTELAYRVTREYAENHSIEEVVSREDQHTGFDLTQLYERLKENFNTYVDVIRPAVCHDTKKQGRIHHIDDDTKLIRFLSEEEVEAKDLLYPVVVDIVNRHNGFLERIFQAIASPTCSTLRHLFPEKLDDFISPTEVNVHTCIVGITESTQGIDEHLQLFHSQYQHSREVDNGQKYFESLQKTVVETFLVGKPHIHLPSKHLWKSFKFKENSGRILLLGMSFKADLDVLSDYMKPPFRVPLEDSLVKELQYEFHSADYHMLLEATSILQIVTDHLIQQDTAVSEKDLEAMALTGFLDSLYEQRKDEMLSEIGIQRLSHSQMSCLLKLKLPYLYSTLELFVQWIKDGVYDFHQLPLVMKKHLEPDDEKKLREISANYEESPLVLLNDLQTFQKKLIQCESHVLRTIDEGSMQTPVKALLTQPEQLLQVIPNTIHFRHYVAVQISIRRLLSEANETVGTSRRATKWDEYASNIWEKNSLKHLRDAAIHCDRSLAASVEEESTSIRSVFAIPDSSPGGMELIKEVAKTLSVSDVAMYLKSIKLDELVSLFADNDVDGCLLWELNDEGMKHMGVTNTFHRIKILSKFKDYLQKIGATKCVVTTQTGSDTTDYSMATQVQPPAVQIGISQGRRRKQGVIHATGPPTVESSQLTVAETEKRPNLTQLNPLKYTDDGGDVQRLYILNRIGRDWFKLGLNLKIEDEDLISIRVRERGDPEDCAIAMVSKWLRSGQNPTWAKLIEALEVSQLITLASDVRKALPRIKND